MGRYLVIGMATRIVAVKKEVIGCFYSGGFSNREGVDPSQKANPSEAMSRDYRSFSLWDEE